MDKKPVFDIADLVTGTDSPVASILMPDVRSGASFTYAVEGTTEIPGFLVVWFYTVEPEDRKKFAAAVTQYETSGMFPELTPPVSDPPFLAYHGTYSVSISSAAPEFEYRTVWGLAALKHIETLNDHLHNAPAALKAMLDLISNRPTMRTEIMGLTRFSQSRIGNA